MDSARHWVLAALALVAVGCRGESRSVNDFEDGAGSGDDVTGLADPTDGDDGPKLDVETPGEVPPPPPTLAPNPPPPISGGTMIVSADGGRVIAADPDRDLVYVVDTDTLSTTHIIDAGVGCEPGRVAEDGDGLAHAACRRSGELVTVDPWSGRVVGTRYACANPRGVAADDDGSILIACAGGSLVRLHADDTRDVTQLGVGLRDIVSAGPQPQVSTFRQPGVVQVDAAGDVVDERKPLPSDDLHHNTARRTLSTGDGGWIMLHQSGLLAELDEELPASDWGAGCFGPQVQTLTTYDKATEQIESSFAIGFATAYDVALRDDQALAAIVGGIFASFVGPLPLSQTVGGSCAPESSVKLDGEPTAVAFDREGRAWVQTREPAGFEIIDPLELSRVGHIELPVATAFDSGHALFHEATAAFAACVSCHPEAHDDGMSWNLTPDGNRRTQALNLSLEGGEPFHWPGDMDDMHDIFQHVRVDLMLGAPLNRAYSDALERWLFAVPPLNPPDITDPDAVQRGAGLFVVLGCASCHAGERLSNEQTMVLGDHGPLQVPSLRGVAFRPPYMHDGRAEDLSAAVVDMLAFSEPGGAPDASEIADLVAYLRSL